MARTWGRGLERVNKLTFQVKMFDTPVRVMWVLGDLPHLENSIASSFTLVSCQITLLHHNIFQYNLIIIFQSIYFNIFDHYISINIFQYQYHTLTSLRCFSSTGRSSIGGSFLCSIRSRLCSFLCFFFYVRKMSQSFPPRSRV